MSSRVCARCVRAPFRALARCLFAAILAAGSAQADVASNETSRRAQALTLSLASGAADYKAAGMSARIGLSVQLRELAAERRTALRDLIDAAPGEVLKAALPSRIAERLPVDVRALLEYRGVMEGELRVVQIDHEEPEKSFLKFGLVTDFGEYVSLHFAGPPTRLRTGQRVIAHGLILEGDEDAAMALGSAETDLELAYCCADDGASESAAIPELPNTLGPQTTAALLVNFTDDLSQPWTVAEIESFVFGEVSDYFQESSHNQTWLVGDTFGWLTVELPADTCELYQFAERVDQAAADAGIDLSSYDRKVIFTPRRPECGFAGAATIGGSPSIARLDGVNGLQVVTHEMGHNLGLHHGHSLDCGLETLSGDCTHQEYGDKTDTMGSPAAGHFSAFHKQRLGWLTEAAPGEVESVSTSGVHTLDVYEALPGSEPKSIKIPAGVDPATGGQRWLYLTYRQPVGFDSFYADRSFSTYCRDDVTDGVYAHLGTDGAAGGSYLLNMRTESCWVDFYGKLDWYNPRLAPGESFVIPDTGSIVSVDNVGPVGATVIINMDGAPPCVTGNPLVAVAPIGDGWGAPSEAEDYSVTVTSIDSAACDARSFALSGIAPTGWGVVFTEPALTLAPGASGSTTLGLTSASDAADGAYDIPVKATNGADQGSGIASYVVSSAVANQPPIAMDDSAATSGGAAVTIAVLANDYDPDDDPLSVVVVIQPGKGTATLNPDGTITYTPGARAKGSDSFAYTVSDGAETASAAVAITFTKGGGDGGGGGKGKGGKK